MDKKLKILGLSFQYSGCHYHRVTLPLAYMENIEGLVTDNPTDDILFGDLDIVNFNRMTPVQEKFHEVAKKSKLIMDLDDDWILPPSHLNHESYAQNKIHIENNIRVSHLVTCTNERIAEKVYPLNKNVHILPNALPYGTDQFTDTKIHDDKIRIFWAGGVSHIHDMKILKYPLQRLNSYKDSILMVMAGYTQNNAESKRIWEKMYSNFTAGETLPGIRVEGLPPRHYMNLYQLGDIMVIPLEKSDWHACKSNLKVLEAAAKKMPVVCQNVEPYSRDSEAPILWVNSQKDWFEHIKYLILNENARKDYGEKLYEWAKEKYNYSEINKKRRELFATICGA
jgi:glycosyltransferase involved in cell wall biosynthesis